MKMKVVSIFLSLLIIMLGIQPTVRCEEPHEYQKVDSSDPHLQNAIDLVRKRLKISRQNKEVYVDTVKELTSLHTQSEIIYEASMACTFIGGISLGLAAVCGPFILLESTKANLLFLSMMTASMVGGPFLMSQHCNLFATQDKFNDEIKKSTNNQPILKISTATIEEEIKNRINEYNQARIKIGMMASKRVKEIDQKRWFWDLGVPDNLYVKTLLEEAQLKKSLFEQEEKEMELLLLRLTEIAQALENLLKKEKLEKK